MRKNFLVTSLVAAVAFGVSSAMVHAATITGGAATFTLKQENPTAKGIYQFEAYFDDTAPYSQIINWNYTTGAQNYPGNLSYGTTDIAGVEHVVLTDPIRPHGATATPVSGRVVNNTTLEFETANFSQANFLSDFAASSFSGFTVGAQGEQIGFTNMTRWTPYQSTGSLINGDFALRYAPSRIDGTRSGLVLASYAAGFNSTLFADLRDVVITFDSIANTLNISGDLLLGEGVSFWDQGASTGLNIGTFSMTAQLTPVPEPTSIALFAMGGIGMLVLHRRRRSSAHAALIDDLQS